MQSVPKETTTKTEPWDGAKPYISKYLGQADALYDQGSPEVYTGPRVAEQSSATTNALNSIEQTAQTYTNLFGNAQNAVNGVTTAAAYSPQSSYTLQNAQNWSNPALGLQQQQAQQLTGANNPANYMLAQTANGSFLNSNPYLNTAIANANQPLIDQFKTQISPGIDSRASLAGRTGSGAAAAIRNDAESTIGNAMTKNANDIMYQNYSTERSNQLAAQNQIGNFYNTDVSNQANAYANLAGTSSGQQGLRMDAANSLWSNQNAQAQTQLQGASMAQAMRDLDFYNANKLAEVGAQRDIYNNGVLQGQIAEFDEVQNQPFENIANMISLANNGGYSNTTKPVYSNSGGQMLGGLTTLLGLFMCDARTKTILRRVGIMPNGIPMYEFIYVADPNQNIYIGPIAQEVQEIKPEAVVEIEDTLFVLSDEIMENATWH